MSINRLETKEKKRRKRERKKERKIFNRNYLMYEDCLIMVPSFVLFVELINLEGL